MIELTDYKGARSQHSAGDRGHQESKQIVTL